MLTILNQEASIANQFLKELRDQSLQKDRDRFRKNVERLGSIMAYELSKKLQYQSVSIQTPLAAAQVDVLKNDPVLLTVLRAGLTYFQGFQNFFTKSDSGFIGAYRKEGDKELAVSLDYLAMPKLQGKVVILIDPMLATGLSIVKSVNALMQHNGEPSFIHIAALVASPEGVKYVHENLKTPHHIWTWAMDEKLNNQYYIVPGLGDAGDLSYGEKL